jgi:phosphoglycolate phosphatase-like HAD superfamily hydrolase
MATKKLILFDIDGTLLRCGPQVRPLFVGALEEVYGQYRGLEGYNFAGKTDPMIVRDLVRATGLSDDRILPLLGRMREIYVERLEAGLQRHLMRLLPGVVELLESLAARQDVLFGLLTGNWRGGAEVKLSRFDLNRFFNFGAFGDDGLQRRELVPVALQRAAAIAGQPFAKEQVLIVGDTALDVDCAKAGGVQVLAVATGFASQEELRAAGADWVFPDLTHAVRETGLFGDALVRR